MDLFELEQYLNQLLEVHKFRDYCPNGLQVEGKREIKHIVTGVTACQALIDRALELEADAILVHHGYFWKNEPAPIRGMKKNRIASLVKNDLSLLAYHLPLDAHTELGNNAQLAKRLGIEMTGVMDERELQGVGNVGVLTEPCSLSEFGQRVAKALSREPLLIEGGGQTVCKIAWCTGGAQGYIDKAHQLGVDAYLSGEVSENTTHSARENGIHYIAAGHHATERYGVMALGEHLAERFNIQQTFVDIVNPV